MRKKILYATLALMCVTSLKIEAHAANSISKDTIADGVFIGSVDVSGMTSQEALNALDDYMSSINETVITLEAANSNMVEVKAGELGVFWDNPGLIEEALNLGKTGNIVKRYKNLEDLRYGTYTFDMDISFDAGLILEVLENKCVPFDLPAVDYKLSKNEEGFGIIEGTVGYKLDVEKSMEDFQKFLENDWNLQNTTYSLAIDTVEPRGSVEELSVVSDVLGTYTTSYSTSGKERTANVENGCRLINGQTLYPGDEFSTLATITPFSEENGYQLAASYLNGLVVESLGGGICQVSTTLYNAVLLSELETSRRSCHSMIVSYVKPSMDAAIAESSGKDFRFVNNTNYPIYVEGITQNRKITFTIYGVETRDPGHHVEYISEVLETTEPGPERIITDKNQPVGYINISSAHTGYKAQLWKVVTENGVEVSRNVINKSTYNMSPRTATVGIKTNNKDYLQFINSGIATGSIDTVKAIAAQINAQKAITGEQ